ncbi:membrane metallo-endopeptidase-like 1 isoform X2 [Ornithodoros turicata]|uniref:membrane metallo-endopeptidase-like 1 isoform X2 n=1 Tax=Ornithodoros turicata TaxID=34597 RepID=UPI00313A466F
MERPSRLSTRSWGRKLTSSLVDYGRRLESMSNIMRPRISPRKKSGDFHTTFSALYPSMDLADSLWDDRTPLEQLLSMGFCYGLFLLIITATYLAYFSTMYNSVSRKVVFGMEFDVCTKDVCLEQARFLESTLNRSAEPCDHFYEYACHLWPKTVGNALPDNASTVWTVLKKNILMEIEGVLDFARKKRDVARSTVENATLHLYNSCINWGRRNKLGILPLRDILSYLSVRYWPLLDVYGDEYNASRLLIRILHLYKLDVFVAVSIQRSLRNRSQYLLNIDNPTFGIPDGLLRFDYPEKKAVLSHYHDFIVRVARFFRTDVRLSAVAWEIVGFEVNLAKTIEPFFSEKSFLWSSAVVKVMDIKSLTPWVWLIRRIAKSAGIERPEQLSVVLWSKKYLEYLSHLFKQPVMRRHLINYMAWRVILALGPATTEEFVNIHQEFLKLIGLSTNAPRNELCFQDVLTLMPYATGQLLVSNSSEIQSNSKQVARMCEQLRATLAHNLGYTGWLSPPTRQHAISKAKGITYVIAEQNPQFSERTEFKTSYVANIVRLLVFRAHKEWQKLGHVAKAFINDIPHSSTDVHYDPIYNKIVIPGALLQPPIYTDGLSPAFNFGSLGFIIASKMMSSLIFEGRCFDKDGTYTCWWDTETVMNYSSSVEACYDTVLGYSNKTDINDFRKQMVTSMAAVGVTYKGFKVFMRKFEEEFEHSSLRNIDMTQNQLFFISFAMTWCESVQPESRSIYELSSSSPGSQLRVELALKNFDKFGKYFACNDNQMNPETKCSIV